MQKNKERKTKEGKVKNRKKDWRKRQKRTRERRQRLHSTHKSALVMISECLIRKEMFMTQFITVLHEMNKLNP
jgi:hypothetical protein